MNKVKNNEVSGLRPLTRAAQYMRKCFSSSFSNFTSISTDTFSRITQQAYNNHVALGRHRICWVSYLREIIKILDNITKQKVSCGEMNVTNIFANTEFMASTSLVNIRQDPTCAPLVLKKETFDILCKAATVVENGPCRHPYKFHLEAIYVNLRQLIQRVPCPVKADNTIKLKHFLENLKDLSQKIMKEK